MTEGAGITNEEWERRETLARMRRHGLQRVRGWKYARAGPLPAGELRLAFADVCQGLGLCFRCGRESHQARQCFAHSLLGWAAGVELAAAAVAPPLLL